MTDYLFFVARRGTFGTELIAGPFITFAKAYELKMAKEEEDPVSEYKVARTVVVLEVVA